MNPSDSTRTPASGPSDRAVDRRRWAIYKQTGVMDDVIEGPETGGEAVEVVALGAVLDALRQADPNCMVFVDGEWLVPLDRFLLRTFTGQEAER